MTGNLIPSQITCNFEIIKSAGKFTVSRSKEIAVICRKLTICGAGPQAPYQSMYRLTWCYHWCCADSYHQKWSSKLCRTLGSVGDSSLSLSSPSTNAPSCAFTPFPASVQAAPSHHHQYQVLQVPSTHVDLRSASPFLLPQYPFPRYSRLPVLALGQNRQRFFLHCASLQQTESSNAVQKRIERCRT